MTWETFNRILALIWLGSVIGGLGDFFRVVLRYGWLFPTGFRTIALHSVLQVLNFAIIIVIALLTKPVREWTPWFTRPWWTATSFWALFTFALWIRSRRRNIDRTLKSAEQQAKERDK